MSNDAHTTPQAPAADDWTTVSYKQPASTSRGRGGRLRRSGKPAEQKMSPSPSPSTSTSAPIDSSSSQGVASTTPSEESKSEASEQKKPHRGNFRRGRGRQYRSVEYEIQGSLPGWYKPPAWDRRPARRDRGTKKLEEEKKEGEKVEVNNEEGQKEESNIVVA
ncbi:hypothetical protein HD806DRAFT_553134 [Xylariaceae sp. AK1471]|nr:hypothetical protein HD806DRAFT_553134 [Xylariaceae sp. AK1471]